MAMAACGRMPPWLGRAALGLRATGCFWRNPMPTICRELPVDEARLRRLADHAGSDDLRRLADHEHPLHGGWIADGEERRDWIATVLMDLFRRTRDREAMAMLYELFCSRFQRLIRHRLRTSRADIDADDVLQETFFAICRYADGFQPDRPHSFRCWAFRILYNTITTAMRRQARHPAQLDALELATFDQMADEATPERAASGREALQAAAAAWPLLVWSCAHAYGQLRPCDRELLDAVDLEGRSYAAVARELGCSVPALKVRVHRARKRIEAHLLAALGAPERAA